MFTSIQGFVSKEPRGERLENNFARLFWQASVTTRDAIGCSICRDKLMCVTTHKGSWVKLLLCLIHDTVEFASRKRDESNQGIKTLLPFPKNITEESDFKNFQDLILALDACYWLHKTVSRSLSRFGDDRAI